MTAVFVHGNPESAAVWDPLVAELDRDDVVRLSPPGFGAPLPAGFRLTPGGYRDWLVGALEELGEPVDLVGHDWGGAHTVAVAMARPDLLRTWTSDAVAVFEPDYVWHELAALWQQPGDGEAAVAEGLGTAERHATTLRARGIPDALARTIAGDQDRAAITTAVPALYRAAAQPVMADLGAELPRASRRPGLVVIATADHAVGTVDQRHRAAGRAGATAVELRDLGHWWMVEDPVAGAQMLTEFWRSVTSAPGGR